MTGFIRSNQVMTLLLLLLLAEEAGREARCTAFEEGRDWHDESHLLLFIVLGRYACDLFIFGNSVGDEP